MLRLRAGHGLAGAVLAVQLGCGAARAADDYGSTAADMFRTVARADAKPQSSLPPEGIAAGSYLILPSAEAFVTFDDNVKEKDGTRGSDWRSDIGAAITFESHLPRHMLNVMLNGRVISFAEHDDQGHLDGSARIEWRLDIDHGNAIGGDLETGLHYEERLTAETELDAAEPVPIWVTHLRAGYVHDIGRVALIVGVDADRTDYGDVTAYDGETIDQDYRDLDRLAAFSRLEYRFSPGTVAHLGLRVEHEDYLDPGEDERDAMSYQGRIGLDYELTRLFTLNATVGYGYRIYDQDIREDFGSYLWEVGFDWRPTVFTQIKGSLAQELAETSLREADGRFDSRAELRFEQELVRDLSVIGELDYTNREFLGIGRTDIIARGRGALQYRYDQNVIFTFAYEHRERDSTEDRFDSDENLYTAGVKINF